MVENLAELLHCDLFCARVVLSFTVLCAVLFISALAFQICKSMKVEVYFPETVFGKVLFGVIYFYLSSVAAGLTLCNDKELSWQIGMFLLLLFVSVGVAKGVSLLIFKAAQKFFAWCQKKKIF